MNKDGQSFPNFHFLEELVTKGLISNKTMDKVKIGTSVLEKKYIQKETQYNNSEKIYNKINTYFNNITSLSEYEKEEIKKLIYNKINKYNRLLRQKLTEKRFEVLSNIGKGYLGRVNLVRDKTNNKIYAMKKLSIAEIIRNSQLFHIKTEKDILSLNNKDNIWQTKLYYSFIDKNYLYFIIDYCPGGDLLNYLNWKDTLTEEEAKFYIAEIILAVDSLHKNKCIHRDIKPENIFIDKYGHIKLGDFGLSILSNNIMYPYTYIWKNTNDEIYSEQSDIKSSNNNIKKIIGFSKVGSVMYVAPEVVENKSYGEEVDWWSVGIIFYEMLIGFTPFFEDREDKIIEKIKNFKKYLYIPKELKNNLSNEATKLIFDFLEDKDKRLGIGGLDEIKKHPFFEGFDWDNVRNIKPPFVPKPFRMKKLDLKMNIKNNRLDVYISKDINNRNYCNLNSYLNKMNLNIYDFYYNKELVDLKYNLDNNIEELIKKQIQTYSKNKRISKNSGENQSTEDILSNPSDKSNKNNINNMNIYNSVNIYNSEIKNKNLFFAFDKINDENNIITKKKKKIDIIPIRNLLFNKNINNNYSTRKDLLYNSIRLNSSRKNKINANHFSIDKNKNYGMTERKYLTKSAIKKDYINNTEIKSMNDTKIIKPKKYDNNILNNIKVYHHEHNNNKEHKINHLDNDIRRMKINGKLFTIKKNLGKYY